MLGESTTSTNTSGAAVTFEFVIYPVAIIPVGGAILLTYPAANFDAPTNLAGTVALNGVQSNSPTFTLM
jgi:hypothetical protein